MATASSFDPAHPFVGIEAKTQPYRLARSFSGGRFRVLGSKALDSNCYHVVSRTCGGLFLLDDTDKEALRRLLWKMAAFSGVHLITYTILSNHFHLLIEIPRKDLWLQRFEGPEGEERLFNHLRHLYSKAYVAEVRERVKFWRGEGKRPDLAEVKLAGFKRRFCDLSLFVKELKERFSRWYNKRHERQGTLWMDRFKSVLVEGEGTALMAVAAYIDNNAVRAGLVKRAEEYEWSGYGEAVRGRRPAQRGLCKAVGRPVDSWKAGGVKAYESLLEVETGLKPEEMESGDLDEKDQADQADRSEKGKKKLTLGELIGMRVRYFVDGKALGRRKYVEEAFERNRGRFGEKRRTGARVMRECMDVLYTLRRLRRRPLG